MNWVEGWGTRQAVKEAQNKSEGEALPLQASGIGSKLRAVAGYPLGLSDVGSFTEQSKPGSNQFLNFLPA